MKQIVYIETSIPSFYYEIRTEPEMVSRKKWTREWWDSFRHNYRLITSEAVKEELSSGDYPNKDKTISLLNDVPLVHIESSVTEIIQTYLNHKLMPENPINDALPILL